MLKEACLAYFARLGCCQRHGAVLTRSPAGGTVRLAPNSMRSVVTGRVLSFGQFGGMIMPPLYSTLLWATGSYRVGFIFCAVPGLLVGLMFLYSLRSAKLD